MADHSIFFKIGSIFKGEGFTKAQQTIKRTNDTIKKAAGATSQLASAIGGLDSKCAQSMGALTSMIDSVMQYGAAGAIAEVGMYALTKVVSHLKERSEAATKRMQDLKAACDAAFQGAMKEQVAAINSEIKSIGDEFERITKQANAFTAAINALQNSQMQGGIVNLEVEKLNAMIDAQSDATRQVVEAEYNLKIAIEKSASTEASWNLKKEEAHQAIVDAQGRVAVIDQQYAASCEKRRELEEQLRMLRENNSAKATVVEEEINRLKTLETQLLEKQNAEYANIDVLKVKEQQVAQDAINAQAQSTIAIRQAELAQKKLNDAKEAERVAAEAERAATELDAAAKNESADIFEMANKSQLRLDDATRKLEQAERNYAALLQKWVDNPTQAGANAVAKNGGSKFGDAIGKSQDEFVNAAINAGIANGSIKNSKDMKNAAKDAGRAFRDGVASGDATQAGRDEQWYDELKKKNPKLLTKGEKDFLDKMDKIKDANKKEEEKRKAAEKELEKAEAEKKKAEEARNQNIEDMKKTLDDINTKLDDVGLQ